MGNGRKPSGARASGAVVGVLQGGAR